jgi:hypothetical protein
MIEPELLFRIQNLNHQNVFFRYYRLTPLMYIPFSTISIIAIELCHSNILYLTNKPFIAILRISATKTVFVSHFYHTLKFLFNESKMMKIPVISKHLN